MTALTESEQATADRFGMFDEESFAATFGRPYDTITCKCGAPAQWRFSITCCGASQFHCTPHAEATRETGLLMLALHVKQQCKFCAHEFPRTARYEDIITETKL